MKILYGGKTKDVFAEIVRETKGDSSLIPQVTHYLVESPNGGANRIDLIPNVRLVYVRDEETRKSLKKASFYEGKRWVSSRNIEAVPETNQEAKKRLSQSY